MPNQLSELRNLFRWNWNPKPIEQPKVDPNLTKLDGLSRSAESIKFSILSVEFWISPKGQVREWLRNHTRLAVLVAIPAFGIIPIVTFGLWQLASWMAALVAIAGRLIIFPILALIAAAMIWIGCALIRSGLNK